MTATGVSQLKGLSVTTQKQTTQTPLEILSQKIKRPVCHFSLI